MKERYLFRGKRIDNGEWVTGGSIIQFLDNGIRTFYLPQFSEKCVCEHDAADNIISFESGTFYKVDPATIGQCTGLRDSKRTEEYPKGQLIFEGDILDEGGYRFAVVFDQNWARFKLLHDGRAIQYPEWNRGIRMEKIGNIHDNPELLQSA